MGKLSDVEVRVLGAVVEKEQTTPEYYPLSLNALVNACNQKSNREPVMKLDESSVSQALRVLEKKGFAGPADSMDNRVRKFEHRLAEAFNFDRRETAVLCELLLRGPQTPGELRSRAERMHHFDELEQVQLTLQRLSQREPPLVKMLPRQPGNKEARYGHLLSENIKAAVLPEKMPALTMRRIGDEERIARLEVEVTELKDEVADLKAQIAAFRKQFE